MPYRRFLPWSILGGALWSVYTCALAYNVATTLAGYPTASLVISGLVTSAMLGVISPSPRTRTVASTCRFVGAFGAAFLISLFVRPLVKYLGAESEIRG